MINFNDLDIESFRHVIGEEKTEQMMEKERGLNKGSGGLR
jgi:hypothetical protein